MARRSILNVFLHLAIDIVGNHDNYPVDAGNVVVVVAAVFVAVVLLLL